MTEPITAHPSTTELAARYNQAWVDHDVEAILGLQGDEMIFHLHMPGNAPVSGVEALRAQFGLFFEMWPDLAFDTTRLDIGHELYVHEYEMRASRSRDEAAEVAVAAVDVIRCREGQVIRKDTYLDTLALSHQLGATGA